MSDVRRASYARADFRDPAVLEKTPARHAFSLAAGTAHEGDKETMDTTRSDNGTTIAFEVAPDALAPAVTESFS